MGDGRNGRGDGTACAPTNAALATLPKGTRRYAARAGDKAMLTGILTCHVVARKLDAKALMDKVSSMGGKAELTTVAGGTLTATMTGGALVVMDEKGQTAHVTTADVYQSNGVIHVVDTVLMPK